MTSLFIRLNFFLINICLFCTGLFGIILNRQNLILTIMSIELFLLSINLNFIYFSLYLDDIVGQLFSIMILTVAAAETAIGLALLIILFRRTGTISVYKTNLLSL